MLRSQRLPATRRRRQAGAAADLICISMALTQMHANRLQLRRDDADDAIQLENHRRSHQCGGSASLLVCALACQRAREFWLRFVHFVLAKAARRNFEESSLERVCLQFRTKPLSDALSLCFGQVWLCRVGKRKPKPPS